MPAGRGRVTCAVGLALDERRALEFATSGAYSLGGRGDYADAHFRRQIGACIYIGGTLPGRANGACPSADCAASIFDLGLAVRLRRISTRRSERDDLRQLFEF